MKLMIDDAVWGFDQIFSEFGEVVTLPGRQISNESLQDCDALIVCLLYTSPSPRDRG